MITTTRPGDFSPVFEVASCFVEREDGKILLLLRESHKSEGDKWGVPAGKVENEEHPRATIIRETLEETSIALQAQPKFFDTFYVRYPDYDFVYHIFHGKVPNDIAVKTTPSEHQTFRWAHPRQALDLELVRHQDDCINFFYFPNI